MSFILLFLWKPDYSYLNGSKSFLEYILFVMMGVSSSIFWVTAFRWWFHDRETRWIRLCSNMGACSLGIYCSQEYFYSPNLWGRILTPYGNTAFYIFWSITILIICYSLVLVLQKYTYTSLFFLGIRRLKKWLHNNISNEEKDFDVTLVPIDAPYGIRSIQSGDGRFIHGGGFQLPGSVLE